jgi:ribonuclease HI
MPTHHLYSDGNYFPRAKKSGFGGYIESPSGEVLIEFSEQIKEPEYSHSFELIGIIRGLQIARDKGITNIVSHCDDKTTTKKLREYFETNNKDIPKNIKPELFQQIIDISKSFSQLKFEYIPRTENKYADSLSRRYSSLMEENFLRQYSSDLEFSKKKLETGIKTNKRIFFFHESMVQNPHKNNPFLVAPSRNRKVRKVAKEQKRIDSYEFLFNEIFNDGEQVILRSFHYDKDSTLKNKFEKSFSQESSNIQVFCEFLSENLRELKENQGVNNLWITSNYSIINNFFEHKEKMPSTEWEQFLKVHKAMDGYENIFFHHLPFDHEFSPEIAPVEKAKQKLHSDIMNLDELIAQFSQSDIIKDQSKFFGAIIRHQVRNYKQTLERELEEIEISEVIEQTVATLKEKGYTSIPFKKK